MELLVNQPRQVTLRNRVIVALATGCVVLMFLVSYLFVIQPAYYPSEEEIISKTAIALTADNSWLEENPDGTYSFYFEGEPSPIILSSESGQAMIADGFLEKSSEEGDNNG